MLKALLKTDSITAFPSFPNWGHFVVEGDQAGRAAPAFCKPMLARPDPLVVLHVPCDDTQDDLLHELPHY